VLSGSTRSGEISAWIATHGNFSNAFAL
jgi:hypothetical protein